MKHLTGKVAVIIGAASDHGKAIALKFAGEDASVVVNDADFSSVELVAESIKEKKQKAVAVRANVCDEVEVDSLFKSAIDKFGGVDILVNSAVNRSDIGFTTMSQTDWDGSVSVQLKCIFNCTRFAAKYMTQNGRGKIINLSSPVPAAYGKIGQVSYATVAGGLEGFTRSLAIELGRYNINVNCIAGDHIDNSMTRLAARRDGLYLEELKKLAVAQVPLKRMGKVEDIANAALFFASDEADFISGQIIYVRGGP